MPKHSSRKSHRRSHRRSHRKSHKAGHLKKYSKKMAYLAAKYRNGDYGRMKWKDVVRKHMKSPMVHKRRSSRRSRR